MKVTVSVAMKPVLVATIVAPVSQENVVLIAFVKPVDRLVEGATVQALHMTAVKCTPAAHILHITAQLMRVVALQATLCHITAQYNAAGTPGFFGLHILARASTF